MATTKTKKTTKKKPAAKPAPAKQPEIINELPEYMQDSNTAELLPFNPLLQSSVITVGEENEQKAMLISEIESLAEINKQQLAVRRQRVELEVDSKKMDAALKLIDGINILADKALNMGTIERILNKQDLSPMDFKFLADAIDKLSNSLKSFMNPSVQDEMGNRKRTKIMAQFQTPSGEKATMAVEVDNGD